MSKILCVPDIHGRDFWINSAREYIDEVDKIVFLGDYHDPYLYEVSKDTSRHRLRDDLVPFVLEHKDKCVCLFGNHDGNYIVGDMADRIDYQHKEEIKKYLIQLNLKLIYKVDNYLFSHAGVLPKWLKVNQLSLEDLETLPFNHQSLLDISPYRGGINECGSCVWGDVREYFESEKIPNIYQIFGHTQLEKQFITSEFACLDCRKTFLIDTTKPLIDGIHL